MSVSSPRTEKLAKGFALPSPPPRTTIDEGSAQRFEAPPAPGPMKRARASRLRRDTSGERLSIYVPPDVAEALRVRCARERRSVSDAVTEAVAEWMKGVSTRAL